MKAEYINHMGDDLTVVNAAKVSFHKESLAISEREERLIRYLARHDHWTPFAHPTVTFRMTAPIFVARQAFKHKVGFTENEVSRRYVDDLPEFFMPEQWRGRPVNAKQGSSDKVVETLTFTTPEAEVTGTVHGLVQGLYDEAFFLYKTMIEGGVAPEQARMVLPQAMYTSWYWTASLAAWARFYRLRSDPHAQQEIQELAAMIGPKMAELFPVSWKELTDESR